MRCKQPESTYLHVISIIISCLNESKHMVYAESKCYEFVFKTFKCHVFGSFEKFHFV